MPENKFYVSKEWRELRARVRKQWLRDGRPCAWCNKQFGASTRIIVDHILPRKQRPDLALAFSNMQCLCLPCHNTKTHSTERTNKKQVNADGFPDDGSWG